MQDSGESTPDPTRCKVGRLIQQHGLDGLGDELEAKWIEEDDSYSLRELADYFNRRLLDAALTEANVQSLDGEVENLYRLLTHDDVSAGARTDAESSLERRGVDPDRLQREFVSHQAVHTYLTDYRDVDYAGARDRDRIDTTVQSIRRLANRLSAVAETNLHSLDDADWIDVGDADVIVDVQVLCPDCGTQYEFVDLLERGGCRCD